MYGDPEDRNVGVFLERLHIHLEKSFLFLIRAFTSKGKLDFRNAYLGAMIKFVVFVVDNLEVLYKLAKEHFQSNVDDIS